MLAWKYWKKAVGNHGMSRIFDESMVGSDSAREAIVHCSSAGNAAWIGFSLVAVSSHPNFDVPEPVMAVCPPAMQPALRGGSNSEMQKQRGTIKRQ